MLACAGAIDWLIVSAQGCFWLFYWYVYTLLALTARATVITFLLHLQQLFFCTLFAGTLLYKKVYSALNFLPYIWILPINKVLSLFLTHPHDSRGINLALSGEECQNWAHQQVCNQCRRDDSYEGTRFFSVTTCSTAIVRSCLNLVLFWSYVDLHWTVRIHWAVCRELKLWDGV